MVFFFLPLRYRSKVSVWWSVDTWVLQGTSWPLGLYLSVCVFICFYGERVVSLCDMENVVLSIAPSKTGIAERRLIAKGCLLSPFPKAT